MINDKTANISIADLPSRCETYPFPQWFPDDETTDSAINKFSKRANPQSDIPNPKSECGTILALWYVGRQIVSVFNTNL